MLTVKKDQPEAYEEIHTFMDKLEAEDVKRKKGEALDSGMREFLEKYEEISRMEKNGTEMSIGLARYVKMPQI